MGTQDPVGRRSRRGETDTTSLAGIAPDLSQACGLHRPGYDRPPVSPNAARWYIHGAAQNRRGTVLAVSHILGASSFSPHRSRAFIRPFALAQSRPRLHQRLLLLDKLLPVLSVFWFVSMILELSHFAAQGNQRFQKRGRLRINFSEEPDCGGVTFPNRSKRVQEIDGVLNITAIVMLPDVRTRFGDVQKERGQV